MKSPFLNSVPAKKLLLVNGIMATFYFVALILLFQRGNIYLYLILILGEVFHVWQLFTLIHAAWETNSLPNYAQSFEAPVDIFITVAGEPVEIVKKTVLAATNIDYPAYHIFILNDGKVANKSNWRQIEQIPSQIDPDKVTCITREKPGGAKAGNINHALAMTNSPFVAILDCDHVPKKNFIKAMAGYFIDKNVAFVQSPQYYKNHTVNFVANAAWQQQTLFFGPICRGKAKSNSLFMCGTNMLIRREALDDVGGMSQNSITEDLLTSLLMHAKGWKSIYVPLILAEGLAPEALGTYWKQQFRWARGSLEVLFKYNPLFLSGLSWQQRVQYLASVTYYLSGIVVLADAILPLFYFYTGLIPITATTMAIAMIFVPYIFITLYSLQFISSYAFSFRAIAFSIASWPIYLIALVYTLLRIDSGFKITAKEKQEGNYLTLATVHILYILAVIGGIIYMGVKQEGINSSLVTNASWGIIYIVMFLPFVRASLSERVVNLLPINEELPAEELIHE